MSETKKLITCAEVRGDINGCGYNGITNKEERLCGGTWHNHVRVRELNGIKDKYDYYEEWAKAYFCIKYPNRNFGRLRKWLVIKLIKFQIKRDKQFIKVEAPISKPSPTK